MTAELEPGFAATQPTSRPKPLATGSTTTQREQQAAQQAAELLLFADGIEDAGHPELARRSRVVARDTIWLVSAIEGERSARRAVQQARDNCLQILANHAGTAATDDGT